MIIGFARVVKHRVDGSFFVEQPETDDDKNFLEEAKQTKEVSSMSCLFDSLASYIENMDASRIRQLITEYLARDPIVFPDLDAGEGRVSQWLRFEDPQYSLQTYVDAMAQPSTWGGAIEIRAFCELFNARVMVYLYQTQHTIEFRPHHVTDDTVSLWIGYTGDHFETMRRIT